jgi:hypothetical protein
VVAAGEHVRGWGSAACVGLGVLFTIGALAPTALADPPLPPAEVRARRLVREERPLWREALALPSDALLLLAWPLEKGLMWAEGVHLDDRLEDFVLFPIRRAKGER